jgi:putative ABC transport system substrate-binding protein
MGADMQRREFITLVGGAAVTWPAPARTQQAMPLIGFLSSRSPGESAGVVAAFRQGLNETGFVEGQNLTIAFRWAEGHYDRLPALAAELVGLRVAVLYAAGGPPAGLAAKAATSVIPVVFSAASDPVGLGLVASLNRPGGNVTGMSLFASDLWAKNVELLKELVPTASVMAYLVNPSTPNVASYLKGAADAAGALGIDIHILSLSSPTNLILIASVTGSRRSLLVMQYPHCTIFANMSWRAGLRAMDQACRIHIVGQPCMSAGYSRVKSQQTCRFKSRPSSSS